jgi:hypothetical protein
VPFDTHSGRAGDGSVPDPSRFTGRQAMRVDHAAIPGLRRSFTNAITKLDKQIEMAITEIRVRPWAGDPVSAEAAQQFNLRSVDAADSALSALLGYQRQLKSALDALRQVEEQYQVIEGDNRALLERQGGC